MSVILRRCFGFIVPLLLAGVALAACSRAERAPKAGSNAELAAPQPAALSSALSTRSYQKPPDAALKRDLNALQYDVTQHEATEPPFQNEFWDNHEAGLYVDIVSGEPLFSSKDKFESGTGWPSFTRPLEPARVESHVDATFGMERTEVHSKIAGSHLGHVFEDGPAPTGRRYCINSASLRFIPVKALEQAGYAQYLPLFSGR
jgi:peptide methionine sulfoxide reductase msrA/msrB